MLKLKMLVLVLIANVFFVNAQEEEFLGEGVEDVQISMDFNKGLYPNEMGNVYFSDSPKAMLMGMLAPKSLDELMKELESDFSGGELKNIKKGETKINKIDIVFVTGNFTDESGEEFLVEMLAKKQDKDSSLVVVSFYEVNSKKTFGEEAKKAIVSAKVSN